MTDVDAMLNTGGSATAGLVDARKAVGREIQTAGFDVLPELVALIQSATSPSPSTSRATGAGTSSVLELVHYIRYGLVQANYFLTGPTWSTRRTRTSVAALAAAGVR